ncbi:hypothetical protein BHM03_00043204 [Ensete ventricosum]|nr:hypothetical protein BHM03_00043204 [Ensete ventricosum]
MPVVLAVLSVLSRYIWSHAISRHSFGSFRFSPSTDRNPSLGGKNPSRDPRISRPLDPIRGRFPQLRRRFLPRGIVFPLFVGREGV